MNNLQCNVSDDETVTNLDSIEKTYVESVLDKVQSYRRSTFTVPCKSSQCVTCDHVLNSTVIDQRFIDQGIQPSTCKSTNTVYLIVCKKCTFEYIGETSRTTATRIAEHMKEIRNNDESNNSSVVKHFNTEKCKIHHLRFTILHRNMINTSVRKEMESKLIRSHSTLFPKGLNQRVLNLTVPSTSDNAKVDVDKTQENIIKITIEIPTIKK